MASARGEGDHSAQAAQTNNDPRQIKQPVPERPEAVRLRIYILCSFWALLVVLGLPVWWKTTSIYRAPLPLQEMSDWNEGRVYDPHLPLDVWIYTPELACEDGQQLLHKAQRLLDSTNFFSPQPLHLRLAKSKSPGEGVRESLPQRPGCSIEEDGRMAPELKLHLTQTRRGDEFEFVFDRHFAQADIFYGPYARESLATKIVESLEAAFEEERAALAHAFSSQNASSHAKRWVKSIPQPVLSALSKGENRAVKYASTYHLTFSMFTPGGTPSSWEIEAAVDKHIQPWITALSSISNFRVDTQLQPYSAYSPSIEVSKDPSGNGSNLSREHLSAFVNAAEWPLSPSVGSDGPTLNFVVYVPSVSEIPLRISSSNGSTSWLVPQWGGITILNPALQRPAPTSAPQVPAHLDLDTLQEPLEIFAAQLLSLVGLPSAPLPLALRLQTLTRLQTVRLHLLTRATLSSLARLYTSLPSIPIPAMVADRVLTSLQSLRLTCEALNASDWESALGHARTGWEDSERAFFEKSMVGQFYFPDEHKVAVYLPLLGPVGVPLVVALVREVVGVVRRSRQPSKEKSS